MGASVLSLRWGGIAYSVRRYYVDEFHFRYVPALPTGSLVLDLGGRKGVSRGQFRLDRYPLKAIYVNLASHYPPDVKADAAHVPFQSDCFDAVICSELLEHVSDPLEVLDEAHRVLKTRGRLFICVPFLYQIHDDPHDYGRYTDLYWREKLAATGFEILTLEKQGLFWSVLVDLLRAYACEGLCEGKKYARIARLLLSPIVTLGKHAAVKWDAKSQTHKSPFFSRFTTGFGIVGIKT